jgi:putative chitinase
MLLSNSVGSGAGNSTADVLIVQLLLNLNRARVGGAGSLAVDGHFGDATLRAIEDFQRQVLGAASPDGVVTNGSATLNALRAGLAPGMTPEKFRLILLSATPARIETFYQPVLDAMNAAGIDTPLRMAHFLAQCGHESGDLHYTEELASGEVYEGRAELGNTEPGDGVRFKGRGLIQLTGRANYAAYGATIGVDLTVDGNWKRVASDPALAVGAACWFWSRCKLNALADRDDLGAITRRVNGGLNGEADRAAHLERARVALLPG